VLRRRYKAYVEQAGSIFSIRVGGIIAAVSFVGKVRVGLIRIRRIVVSFVAAKRAVFVRIVTVFFGRTPVLDIAKGFGPSKEPRYSSHF
jgi:hypothetical protein